eukprot:TRINITY_DN52778_c0_g1_i1.p1 TRINITY_DN52778_c0_g1~~TRINITY_DN52778_c0_g1_i1.p1  ORF type:complete len:380 (-),score=25.61 TRINITY_DN52778_c0_g1_i1:51-1112(-)
MKRELPTSSLVEQSPLKTFKIHCNGVAESLTITKDTPIEQIERTIKARYSLETPGPLVFKNSQGTTTVFSPTLPEGFDLFIKDQTDNSPTTENTSEPKMATNEKITLWLKSPQKDEFSVEVSPHGTIKDIKKEIHKAGITKSYKRRLIFKNEELVEESGKTLVEYGIHHNAELQLMLQTKYTKKTLLIKTEDRKLIPIQVKMATTIKNVKAIIEKKKGISTDDQKLFLENRELLDDEVLYKLNLVNAEGIRLEVAPEIVPSKKILVKELTRKEWLSIEIELDFTVGKVKKLIERMNKVPKEEMQLFFKYVKLEDCKTLKDYSIEDGSMILFTRNKKGQRNVYCFQRRVHCQIL